MVVLSGDSFHCPLLLPALAKSSNELNNSQRVQTRWCQSIYLPCNISHRHGDHDSVIWLFKGTSIEPQSGKLAVVQSGLEEGLLVSNISSGDLGRYSCRLLSMDGLLRTQHFDVFVNQSKGKQSIENTKS